MIEASPVARRGAAGVLTLAVLVVVAVATILTWPQRSSIALAALGPTGVSELSAPGQLLVPGDSASGVIAPPMTATGSATFTYDIPSIARVEVYAIDGTVADRTQSGDVREWSASPTVEGRGASTTPSSRSVATNVARLNLPFRVAGLRSQVDDVVRHFDEFGTPPPGVAQGGLKGYPKGTYGGQGLPQKPLGYYTESDVWVSGGGVKRSAERVVFGQGGEVYYTPTHYDGFVRIR